MKQYVQLCMCILLLSLSAFFWKAFSVANEVQVAVQETSPKLQTALDNLQTAEQNLATAAATINKAARAQEANWTATSREAAKTGKDLRRVVVHFDRILTNQVVPLLETANQQVLNNGSALTDVLISADKEVVALQDATGAVTLRVADPNVQISLEQIALAATQMAQASAHANKVLADGEIVADHYTQIVMKPVSWARRIGEYTLSFGADARVLFAGGK